MAQFYSHNDFFNSGDSYRKTRIENDFQYIIEKQQEVGVRAVKDFKVTAIETVMNNNPFIRQAAVICPDTQGTEPTCVAFVVPHLVDCWKNFSFYKAAVSGTFRRSEFRIQYRTACRVKLLNKKNITHFVTELIDISCNGAAIRNRNYTLSRNAAVELTFQLTNPNRKITIQAGVVNKSEEKIGLVFHTTGDERENIAEWINATMKAQQLVVMDYRRTSCRFPVKLPCKVQFPGSAGIATETKNISAAGLAVQALPPAFTPGTESIVTFDLDDHIEEIKGKIAWNNGSAAGIRLFSGSLPGPGNGIYNREIKEILEKDLHEKLPGFNNQVEIHIVNEIPVFAGKTADKMALAALHDSLKLQANTVQATLNAGQGTGSLFDIFKSGDLRFVYDFFKHCGKYPGLQIKPAPAKTYYPLTGNQKRIFMTGMMHNEQAALSRAQTFLLMGNLDKEKLEEHFKTIVKRHDALRTGFEVIGEDVYQKIHEDAAFSIDYRTTDEQTVDKIIQAAGNDYDLKAPPLFKLCLVQLSSRKHILIFRYHQIILDDKSPLVIMEEVLGLLNGDTLPELTLQLKDYAVWQENMVTEKIKTAACGHWIQQYNGAMPVLNLATDFPRPNTQSFEGDSFTFTLPDDLTQKIIQVSGENDTGPGLMLLAAYKVLLFRYTGQDDIVIGTDAERTCPGQAAGMFANTIILRSRPAGNKKFCAFLREINTLYQDACRDQEFQLDTVLNQLGRERDPSRNPLFDAAYSFLDHRIPSREDALVQWTPVHGNRNNCARFDLTLEAVQHNRRITLTLEYCTKLFKLDSIAQMAKCFLNLLQSIVHTPGQELAQLEILSVPEKQTVLYEFNKVKKEFPGDKTITGLFEAQVDRTPDNTALVAGDKKLTYSELDGRANQLAHFLAATAGIKPETPVGVLMQESFDLFVAILGILKAGGAYVPIDPALPGNRIRMIIEDSRMPFIICDDNHADFIIKLKAEIPALCGFISPRHFALLQTYPVTRATAGTTPRNLAYMIYTSGSTGVPKGVMIEHRSLVNLCTWHNARYAVKASDRTVKYAGLGFDASVWEIFPYLAAGAALYIIPGAIKCDPELLNRFFEANEITICFLPTQMCEEFMNIENHSLRIMLTGGDKLKKFVKKNYRLMNNYGPTENTVVTTSYEVTAYSHNIPIGRPVYNNQLYILDKNNGIQPVGVPGELCIGGESLARGYAGRPELDAAHFTENPLLPGTRLYRTGDLARWLPDGNVEFLGRIDHQVKIRGFRIELGEIESRLAGHPAIREAVVIDLEDAGGQKFLCAYYTAAAPLDLPAVKAFLASTLPDYMIPAFYVHLDKIPLNTSGKIDRKALPALEQANLEKEKFEAPAGKTEKILAAWWQELLGIGGIGVNDNFFNLGGHSLKATVLAARIQADFHVKIALQEIFKHPTIREIAGLIAAAGETADTALKPAAPADYYPLSSAQQRMYIVEQFEKESISYNEVIVMTLEGKVSLEKLENIFKALIKRHEILRTGIVIIDDNVYQRVYDNMDFSIRYAEGSARELETMAADFKQSYDLKKPPFFRVGLIRTGIGKYFFILGAHHIILDGTSLAILMNEIIKLCNGDSLPELRVQYKDYAVWQNAMLTSENIKKQEAYWLKKFEQDVPVLNLPADYPRPPLQSFEGAVYSFGIDQTLTRGLLALNRQFNTTLYMTLLAAFKVLLYKYTEQEDIEVGSGIAGRNQRDLYDMLGMFVNMIIIRSSLAADKPFSAYLAEIRELAFEAFENQDCQFNVLVHQLNRKRDPSRNPLFDAAFVLQNVDDYEVSSAELQFKKYPLEFRKTSKFDLTLEAMETADGIACKIEYCTKLFREETIRRMAEHFVNIVGCITANPHLTLAGIGMLSAEEKQLVLTGFNNTAFPYPRDKTIHRLFEEQADRTPGNPVLVHNGNTMTYCELDRKANQLAYFLVQRTGLKPDSLAAVIIEESFDMFVAIMGILKAGGAYVPVDPALPENRIKEILLDSGAAVAVSARKHIRLLNRLQWECPGFDHYLCLDSADVYAEEETEKNYLMDAKLWHYVGENADTAIAGGGWKSSYTGQDLSREEMDEYAQNILIKLRPYINRTTRVLEIGCASGLSMFALAPHAGFYYGTDLSDVIIQRNRERINAEGIGNITLETLAAHEIDQIPEKEFDVVIINSVIQCFHGHNYLRSVLLKAIALMKDSGIVFIGDIMDQDLKDELLASLKQFRDKNSDNGYKTKTDFSAELFVSRRFFEDMAADNSAIKWTLFTKKIHTIKNELTQYRYDTILQIDKTAAGKEREKHKHQYSNTDLLLFSTNRLQERAHSHNTAYAIYTSGSTGKPKGVLVAHNSLVNLCTWHNNRYAVTGADRATKYAGLGFDASVWEIFPYLIAGAPLYIVPGEIKYNAGLLNRYFDDNKITIGFLPTQMCEEFMNMDNHSLRIMLTGGDKLKKFIKKGYQLVNNYGPTENTVVTTSYDVNEYSSNIPIGKPVFNCQIYILSKTGSLQPAGIPGELCIAGEALARGYWQRPELDKEKFAANPFKPGAKMYRTGDLARWLPDGNIEFLGRIDFQVKIRGFRVELGEIENRLLKHADISEVIVVNREGDDNEQYLCAYFVSGKKLNAADLKAFLVTELPHYMIPAYFIQLEKMPLNTSGKIDRKALPEPFGIFKTGVEFVAPSTAMETQLALIWQNVLKVKNVGIHDNFFDLGGHSLKITIMAEQIRSQFGIDIPLLQIFQAPTIKQLADYIQSAGKHPGQCLDPNMVLLRQGNGTSEKRLFLVHTGNGEVSPYWRFAKQISAEYTIFGIKAGRLPGYAPVDVSIEELARDYIGSLRTVQEKGPYYIMGWCLGGTIAFEIVHQLEKMGENVILCTMVNTELPDSIKEIPVTTTASELAYINNWLKDSALNEQIKHAHDVTAIWKTVVDYFQAKEDGLNLLKKAVNDYDVRTIPHFAHATVEEIIYYINLGRTLQKARCLYNPAARIINTEIHFFEPEEIKGVNMNLWKNFTTKQVNYYEIAGSHFSIFKMPHVEQFAAHFNNLLSGQGKSA